MLRFHRGSAVRLYSYVVTHDTGFGNSSEPQMAASRNALGKAGSTGSPVRVAKLLDVHLEAEFEGVIRGMNEVLLRAEISLGRLDRSVAEEQLNLLKFATRRSTQLRAVTAEVMRRDAGNADRRRIRLEHLPHNLLAQALARQ
jgi:hypothetical protein